MPWNHFDIAGKPADVFDPPSAPPRSAVIYLDTDARESLTDRPVFTQLLDKLRLGCVCAQAPHCWWSDRVCVEFDPAITAERYVLDRVAPFAQARWNLAPRALGILGIGVGGQGALRLAFKHPDFFPAVAAIAPAIDHYELYGRGSALDDMYASKEQCRQDSATMHVHPSHQPPHIFFCVDPDDRQWFRGCDRLHEKLGALGVAHDADLTTRAGGHSWDYFNHMAPPALRFLAAGLETEGRRLL
jgi:S-formylglutathione hydrolase